MGDLAGGPLFISNVLFFSSTVFSFWWATSFIYYRSVSTLSSCTPLTIQYVLEQYQMWRSTQNLLSGHHWNQCWTLLWLIMYLITDSPTSQYRNAGCMYLSKKFAEEQCVDTSWIFTESRHGKGHMDSIGTVIKNATDDVAIALESMTDVSVATSTNVITLHHLPNVAIATYSNNDDMDIFKAKISKHLRISWKNFKILKVHEVFLEKAVSNRIQWKKVSADSSFCRALLATNVKKRTLGRQHRPNGKTSNTNHKSEQVWCFVTLKQMQINTSLIDL